MRSGLVCGLATLALAVTAQEQGQQQTQSSMSLSDVLSDKNLTKFRTLVDEHLDLNTAVTFLEDTTILAPNDDAFERLQYSNLRPALDANDSTVIRDVLFYHFLKGTYLKKAFTSTPQFPSTYLTNDTLAKVTGGQKVLAVEQAGAKVVFVSGLGSRSSLITADLTHKTGVVHVIDTFLIPPQSFINSAVQFNATAAGGAMTKAQLNDELDNTRDVTVFAPSNAAFQKIGSSLANMTVEELGQVMRYHIVNGTVWHSSSLTNNTQLQTAQGNKLTVRTAGNSVYVNSAQVIQQDLLLSNGILHVIDNVLNYNNPYAFPNPEISSQPPVLPGSPVSDVPFTTDLPQPSSSDGSDASETADATSVEEATATSTSGNRRATNTRSAAAPRLSSPSFHPATNLFVAGGVVFWSALMVVMGSTVVFLI